ncbi:hypothetical protein A5789_29775 [Nocardia sp. 852002-51101_SCH5132738]|nr:hypothetical protein A5789_29775 [Nocardia sp. 852002-51101_SCH5132738]OBB48461.1 hypothetical protein A5748_21610 [Nocardia sp. 852002-51244_SCH5132740]OBF85701.1 hypothetical protein A9X06_13145 [Mycobacterium sp. 852002-51759_SCH5129042]
MGTAPGVGPGWAMAGTAPQATTAAAITEVTTYQGERARFDTDPRYRHGEKRAGVVQERRVEP